MSEKLPMIDRPALGRRDSNLQLPPISTVKNLIAQAEKPIIPRTSFLGTVLNTDVPTFKPITTPTPSMAQTLQTKKRPIPAEEEEEDESDPVDIDLSHIDMNCDQVRRKINTFLDAGEMKVGEFQKALGISGKSYTTFMGQGGRDKGHHSECYTRAWAFFKKRDMKGIPMPRKKQKSAPVDETTIKANETQLEGEQTDNVPVYDTCDEIRRKINAHLRKDGITQAQFLRDLMAQYHAENRKIQSKQLADFRAKKGPDAGNTSCVYYASYCYFEKVRIAEGKPKSKDRLAVEKLYPEGMDTVRPRRYCYVAAGTVPVQDKYGRVSYVRER